MPNLLAGLRRHTDRITAIVTVGDDGGSSGRLRRSLGLSPPGDVRRCLLALADVPQRVRDLCEFRFEGTDIEGHPLGNLVLAALAKLAGDDFPAAVREVSTFLRLRGQVVPCASQKLALVAVHPDGSKSTGEMAITQSEKPIVGMELRPDPGPAPPEALEAIRQADLLVLAPGSLVTSIVPHLLVPDIRAEVFAAVQARGVPLVFVVNLMTQPGETRGFDALAHIAVFRRLAGEVPLTAVIAHDGRFPAEVVERYRAQGAEPVVPPVASDADGLEWRVFPLAQVVADGKVRHDPARLARSVLNVLAGRAAGV